MVQSSKMGIVPAGGAARLASLVEALAKRGPDWTGRFDSLTGRFRPAWLAVVLLWFLLVVPAIFLRGYHYEEGTVIGLARGALEDGYWLVPHQFGLRFPERPALMSFVIAVLGWIFGGIGPVVARLPPVLSLLAGGLMVFSLVRQRAGAVAALFGALCFLISPALLQKLITAEPDVILSALLFAAFLLWWDGQKTGHVSLGRWLAVGAMLVFAGLTKGPQPVGYFTLGIGVFLVTQRQWRDLPGFILANAMAGIALIAWYAAVYRHGDFQLWADQSRLHGTGTFSVYLLSRTHFVAQLLLEMLPGLLVAVPFVLALAKKRELLRDDLVLALLCYATMCTLPLIVWPNANTRYAMPAILAVAALAGLGYERARAEWPRMLDVAFGLALTFAVYGVAIGWIAMPLRPDLFQASRISADKMLAEMRQSPAPLICTFNSINNNVISYLPAPIHMVPIAEFSKLKAPLWAYIYADEAARVRKMRPDLTVTLRAVIHNGTNADLYRVDRK
jgi:4-amino-4-deoxy-L-arabinose transferase-like glycosyltransferase